MKMQLYTTVEVSPMPLKISMEDGVVTMGSCFADAIGRRMEEGGFRVERNPFGTLYNPASVAAALERMVEDREITDRDLVQHEGLWHSWHHHGSFSRPTAEETLEVCNSRIHQSHKALHTARVLMVTFGTAWVYGLIPRLKGEGARMVVANCHKLPAAMFERRRMPVGEIVALWKPLLVKLREFNPGLDIIFTVSPIRHLADGAHGNQLSKATLLMAVEELLSIFSLQIPISYFPAYEIVLDELRDYRFYGPDLSHPSPLAEDIVYDRFQQSAMTPATIQQAHLNAKKMKQLRHIPLH
ncbi:MAG: GSCFA domain-containing protein [Bacteroidales bacterium]|nr:GSCFA domain-containing protein [Bacteroidales bacterium]